jgi:uncharacterized RDD family membrane protein YckC
VVHGALATKLRPSPVARKVEPAPRATPGLDRAVQTSLFQQSNVIPIAAYGPTRTEIKPKPRTPAPGKAAKPAGRRPRPVPEGQGTLDFLPAAPPKPRQLSTTVDAVIYCEAPVASTLHRAVASAIDWSMVLIGYVAILVGFALAGGAFELNKTNLGMFAGMFLLTGFTYGLIFALAGAETFGNHCTQLRLTTFEGFPPELKHRLLRFGAACLSRCTLLGLLWSLVDEESLSWQDHISHTFPTPREAETLVFRKR